MLILAGALWPIMSPNVWIFGAGVAIVWAIATVVAQRPSRYDLKALARVHELEEMRAIELEEPEEYDSVVCLCCSQTYSTDFRICPYCGSNGRSCGFGSGC
jgi:hypothetical protein